nr:MAG TPA: hypothetical protein [Caudoviricetes sp.]
MPKYLLYYLLLSVLLHLVLHIFPKYQPPASLLLYLGNSPSLLLNVLSILYFDWMLYAIVPRVVIAVAIIPKNPYAALNSNFIPYNPFNQYPARSDEHHISVKHIIIAAVNNNNVCWLASHHLPNFNIFLLIVVIISSTSSCSHMELMICYNW